MLLYGLASGTNMAAAQTCLGRIAAIDEAIANYNPFHPVAQRRAFAVTIENTGSQACQYRVQFKAISASHAFGFGIAAADGTVLADSDSAPGTQGQIISRMLNPAEAQRLELIYSLPEGQFLSPGQFRTSIDLVLTPTDDEGAAAAALRTVQLPLLCSVDDHLGVNIAGAGLSKTVDFGELAEGMSRRVVIEARANRSFLLEITSLHGGALALEPPYQHWRVEYDLDLNGSRLKLPFKGGPYERGGIGGQSFAIEFRIGDVVAKRAGLYEDEITINIAPAP
ncbi:MAG: hypothetical protein KTR19_04695 [Hyphomicrobiales bacterium]|nr:hypothetical protein [Hyphomicrobiales bacterium]